MKSLSKYWWLILLKGIILVVLAFFFFGRPMETMITLALYIGIGLVVTGIFLIFAAFSVSKLYPGWGWKLAEGIIDLLFGFILLSNPALTATTLPIVFGFWVMVYGIMMFTNSFGQKKEGDSYWWLGLFGGVITVLIGYMITSNILVGAATLSIWIASGFLIFGIFNILLSFTVKKAGKILS